MRVPAQLARRMLQHAIAAVQQPVPESPHNSATPAVIMSRTAACAYMFRVSSPRSSSSRATSGALSVNSIRTLRSPSGFTSSPIARRWSRNARSAPASPSRLGPVLATSKSPCLHRSVTPSGPYRRCARCLRPAITCPHPSQTSSSHTTARGAAQQAYPRRSHGSDRPAVPSGARSSRLRKEA